MAEPLLAPPTVPTFYFIGVTTGYSSSKRMFPAWMEALRRPEVVWQGIDLAIHDDPARYRVVVEHIRKEPLALGALVTTHKIDLLAACRDLFDELGPYARITDEVSSIAKDDGKLVGRATDPVAGGLSLDAILGADYFARTGGEVLLLGAGGSAVALSLHLLQKQRPGDRPRRLVVINRSAGRLERLAQMVAGFPSDIEFEFVQNADPARNDALLAAMPPGTLVVNATGMGKDTPGSPLTDTAIFPERATAWELNYRGELGFLRQAQAQQTARNLTVADGWDYFIHGWSQVISHVLHVAIDPPLLARLSELAAAVR
ncbi:MAG: shikimate dehydrogenase [Chloroflexi bacterium]|nr:MAG: shikimate dehydrogenase [Chloroflexota bacterium]